MATLRFLFAILLFYCTILHNISCRKQHDHDQVPKIIIENGKLEGIYLESRGGRRYAAFMGIPYADPPEKFEVAKPASPWDGTRDASKFGSVCVQFDPRIKTLVGNEDCLFLNVFKPELVRKGKLPVMVFIHGGAFQFGTSDENGADYLMDENVVLVTLNYRLGAYGFLTTEDEVIPGNLGLKDQVLALRWVQENIEQFGGDPSEVTLFGESAGGGSVGLHILSPSSQGLFQRAICISATSLTTWVTIANPKSLTLKFAQHLNCSTSSSIEIKECLKTKTYEEITKALPSDIPLSEQTFIPVVEAKDAHDAFLTETPRKLYESGKFAKIPLLITANEHEGLLLNSAGIMKSHKLTHWLNTEWKTVAPTLFYYADRPSAEQEKISKSIQSFYFGNKDPMISADTFTNLTNLYTDARYIQWSRETALLHAPLAPTYFAILSFKGIWSHIFAMGYTEVLGLGHADDLQYYFTNTQFPKFPPNSDALAASHRLIRIFVNFAKSGHPTADKGERKWKPIRTSEVGSRTLNWMYVTNREDGPMSKELDNRMRFWDTMLKRTVLKKNDPKIEI